jgi:hypothetical protein
MQLCIRVDVIEFIRYYRLCFVDLDRRSDHVIPSTARDLPPHQGDPSSQAPQDDLCGRNGSQGPFVFTTPY